MQDSLKRVRISGTAVAVDGNDINTDLIIPARRMKCVTFDGLGAYAFEDARRRAGGTHPLDDPARRDARVLLVERNFGSGSSREHAPQALLRWNRGIAAIVGESFAEIFFGNCAAIGIPCVTLARGDLAELRRAAAADATLEVTVDLEKMEVRAGSLVAAAAMPEGERRQLMTGRWDSLTELRDGMVQVKAMAQALPGFGR